MGSTESNSSGTYPINNHHHITWEAPRVTHQARIPVITITTLDGSPSLSLFLSLWVFHQTRIPVIAASTLHGKHREYFIRHVSQL